VEGIGEAMIGVTSSRGSVAVGVSTVGEASTGSSESTVATGPLIVVGTDDSGDDWDGGSGKRDRLVC
jgi:hypothetical protein